MTFVLIVVSSLCVVLGALVARQRRALSYERSAAARLARVGSAITQQLADLPLAVCAFDETLTVCAWGLGAEATFGTSRDAALGRSLPELVAPLVAREAFATTLRAVLVGECVPRLELACVASDGHRVVCEWFFEALRDAEGRLVGGLGLARDVTAARHEASLRSLQAAVFARLADDLAEDVVLGGLVEALEEARPDLACALLRVDVRQAVLRVVAAGRLDEERRAALAAIPVVRDVDVLAATLADVFTPHGGPTCWVRVVRGEGGGVLGAVLCVSAERSADGGVDESTDGRTDGRADFRTEDAFDAELLDTAARLCATAIARRLWERERHGAARLLREAFGVVPRRLLVLDADGRIALCNRAAANAWGQLADDLVGRDLRTLLAVPGEADALLAAAAEARATTGPVQRPDVVLTDAPGCRRIHALTAASLAAREGRSDVLVLLDDVTEARRLERARDEREARAQDAARLSGLGVLAGGLAHEFAGKLNAILSHVEHLRADARAHDASDAWLEDVRRLEVDALEAADLVRLVLACSGEPSPAAARLDLDALLREMAHLLDAAVPSRARLDLETSGDLPPIVGDVSQLRRLVLALVENAGEALPRGEGRIVVRTSARRLLREDLHGLFLDHELPEGRYAVLEVVDTGEGLSPTIARRVFDPFFTTKATGRGLGMSAVLGIVRGHGGTIQLDSEAGRGTCVSVLLPAAGLPGRIEQRVGV